MSIATIDELAVELRALAAEHAAQDDRNGYFAALYTLMTERVRDDIGRGRFSDGERLQRLACHFAMRYFHAWERAQAGEAASASWAAAFDAAPAWRPVILQHLLLGMNAHINLDLGIAAAEVADGDSLEQVHGDFMEINHVLSELMGDVQVRLASVSPWIGIIDGLAGRKDDVLFNFSMRKARDAAWRVAERYSALDAAGRSGMERMLDQRVADFARFVIEPGWLASSAALVVRARERHAVADVIAALHDPAR